ncbi:hypothetical protein [Lentzea flava]|uniref:hypothetical protein n=1 Tax=Lentzea flava TaxID=103732 RepID=UPI00167033B7|nr:hypothetical protein [Lentzea flava]MCP2199989.1 hypothetical protein [Lentzea flava]
MLICVVTFFAAVLVITGALGLFSIVRTTESGVVRLTMEWPGWDPSFPHLAAMLAIGTFGAVGGVLAGAWQILRMGGVYNPSLLPLTSLFVKIQMGALCALAGVLAILGGVAPEISVSEWRDVAGFALVFGAAQQLLGQVIDGKVKALISSEPRDQAVKK